jgi:uncharacterized membrane protein YjjP (DUF1212 family)
MTVWGERQIIHQTFAVCKGRLGESFPGTFDASCTAPMDPGLPLPVATSDKVGFVLRLGRALHRSGSPAPSLEDALERVSQHFGLSGQFFVTPTSLFASFGAMEAQRTHLIRVQPGDVNLGRLSRVDAVTKRVLAGELSPADGSSSIDALVALTPEYPASVRVAAYGVAAAAVCYFLGGGPREAPVAILVGLAIGLLSLLRRFVSQSYVFELLAASIGSALVSLIAGSGYRFSISIAVLAGIIVLVPGLSLTVAMLELASRHLASGTARLSGAFIVFIAIVFGVTLGSTLVTLHTGPLSSVRPLPFPWWVRYVALGLAPMAFSVLLRARLRDVPWVFVASLVGYAGLQAGNRLLGPALGAAMGGLTVGLMSNVFERRGLGPALVPLVPGVLLLVPGSVGYRAVHWLLIDDVVTGVNEAFTMLMTGVALAAGLLLAQMVLPSQKPRE